MADKKIVSGKLLGIDIGVSSIKVAEIMSDKDGVSVTALGETPMPEDVLENEDIKNPRQLASIIKTLVKDCGITSKKCVVSITAPNNVLVKSLEVPKSDNEKQTRLSIKYEVERLFPHSNYDTEFDFAKLPSENEEASNQKVFVAAAYRKLVEDILNVVKYAGLTLEAIEVAELGVGRSLIDSEDSICGVLDLGASKSSICVYDGYTVMTPSLDISVSGNTFTSTIADNMGISIQEAEEFKKDYAMLNLEIIKEYYDKKYSNDFEFDSNSFDTAFDDPNYNPAYANSNDEVENPFEFDSENSSEENPFEINQEPNNTIEENPKEEENLEFSDNNQFEENNNDVTDDLKDETDSSDFNDLYENIDHSEKSDDVCRMLLEQLENLQNEIRSQLDEYYNTTGINVQKLIITGGTSKIPGMAEFLKEYLGIEVLRGNPQNILKVKMDQTDMNIFDDLNSKYPVAIGLAMRDFVE